MLVVAAERSRIPDKGAWQRRPPYLGAKLGSSCQRNWSISLPADGKVLWG